MSITTCEKRSGHRSVEYLMGIGLVEVLLTSNGETERCGNGRQASGPGAGGRRKGGRPATIFANISTCLSPLLLHPSYIDEGERFDQ
ncbi:hypothetical protein R1flu_026827 [Riccia fluitans]|uniref:Uncharacterized protein n=1 Tax=Riccia fluitans TaxID=41844 RepID=A0ABD1XH29_9MARC